MTVLSFSEYFVLILLVSQVIIALDQKRILLNSDADMAAELLRLQRELTNVTQQLNTVLSEVNALKSSNGKIH